MKHVLIIICSIFTTSVFGQLTPTEEAKPIVEEGKLLYRSEMASWYGTDLFLEKYNDRNNIGGYFSYIDNDIPKCVFFSKAESPKVIGTVIFDNNYNVKKAKVNIEERTFTGDEFDLYEIRRLALLEATSDTMFKTYESTNLNFIPIINGGEKKVYILTGTSRNDVVIFGNDYLLTFDKENKLLVKKSLHKNIIPVYYGTREDGKKVEGAIHSHLPETGHFITATDICTLMLYSKLANWEKHTVISEKYLNLWNCQSNQLVVIPRDVIEKVRNDPK